MLFAVLAMGTGPRLNLTESHSDPDASGMHLHSDSCVNLLFQKPFAWRA